MGRSTDQSPGGVLAVAIVPTVLCIIVVALRFYTRRYQQKVSYGWDDWLTLPALFLTIGMAVIFIIGVAMKVMAYPTPLPPNPANTLEYSSRNTLVIGKLQYAYQLTQFVQLFLVKTSVVLFYRRIFCSHNKFTVFNVLTKATLVIIFLWSLVFLIATVFQCDLHVDAAWLDGATYLKECPGVDTKNIAISVSDFIIDLWIITMPIPPTWGLHLDLKRKIAVSAVFLLGLVAVAASLTRMVTNIIAVYSLNLSVDPDLFITSTMYWGMFESGMALFAACLPSLRFLFGHMSPDALIRSIRSMLSLESLRSNGSSSRRQRTNSEAGSNASDVAITKPETILGVGGNNNHTYIASDSEIGRDSNIQLGQIYVKKGFQTEKTKV